jgi:hypothetical protein
MRNRHRWSLAIYAALGALWALALVPVAEAATTQGAAARQSAPHRAVVVVDDGAGPREFCVRFDGEITGLAALQATGLPLVLDGFAGMGSAVCKIDGTGCSASSCLTCAIPLYWQYLRAAPGASTLTASGAGASTTTVTDGAVEYWRWTSGGAPPAKPSVDAVCGARPATTTTTTTAASPAPAPTPTPTPVPGSASHPSGPSAPAPAPPAGDDPFAPPVDGPPAADEASPTGNDEVPENGDATTDEDEDAIDPDDADGTDADAESGDDDTDDEGTPAPTAGTGRQRAVGETGTTEPGGSTTGRFGPGLVVVVLVALGTWATVARRRSQMA